jgi:pimeloyl-ACP methyl ester carboxylesterase
MRLVQEVPSQSEMVVVTRDMLHAWGVTRASFIGHSFGSIVVAWMAKSPDTREMVGSTTFIDPVCFLLCKHDVAYNFLYREPTTLMQLIIHYFAARELHIAYALSRHFFW